MPANRYYPRRNRRFARTGLKRKRISGYGDYRSKKRRYNKKSYRRQAPEEKGFFGKAFDTVKDVASIVGPFVPLIMKGMASHYVNRQANEISYYNDLRKDATNIKIEPRSEYLKDEQIPLKFPLSLNKIPQKFVYEENLQTGNTTTSITTGNYNNDYTPIRNNDMDVFNDRKNKRTIYPYERVKNTRPKKIHKNGFDYLD